MYLSIILLLSSGTKQDCFCGSRDATPNVYGYNAKNKQSGHLNNLNSKLAENYNIASIVNYIDIFISKLNRLYIKKSHWPVPMKISGVKNLDFREQNNDFNVFLNHQISKHLFLKIQIKVPKTYQTKNHFSLFSTLVRTNAPPEKKLGAKESKTQSGIINYEVKRASLSHFYGNQLAVDVCRFMYATINKILVDAFQIDLKYIIYRNVATNAKSHLHKRQCIITPSFKVYLGVNQIEAMVTSTRNMMDKYNIQDSVQLEKQLKADIQGKDIDTGAVNVPKLKRRMSALLTPIIMEEDGREMLASDYEGTEEYQNKVKEVYQVELEEFMNNQHMYDQSNEDDMILDLSNIKNKQKQGSIHLGKPEEMAQKKKLQDMGFEHEEVFEMDKRPSIKFLKKEDDIGNLDFFEERALKKIDKKKRNIMVIDDMIQEAIIANYDSLPKTGESKSEGYLNELYHTLDLRTKNSEMLKRDLGIDLDEDDVELTDEQRDMISQYLKSQFVLLRTTPLQTQANSRFRRFFGSSMEDSFIPCDNKSIPKSPRGKLLQKRHSLPNPKSKIEIFPKSKEPQAINIIGRHETVVINQDDFDEVLDDGLSQKSSLSLGVIDLTLIPQSKSETIEDKVDIIFSKNDFAQEPNSFNAGVLFGKNSKLTESQRNEMIKKIIEVRKYIYDNGIKCDFEIYSDSTMFINIPDLELSELLNKLNLIMEAGTEEQMAVLVTNEITDAHEEVQKQAKIEVVESMNEHGVMEAEVIIDMPGFSKEQVQKMILMMTQDRAFMDINNTIINDEKQDEMDQIHLMGYDITEYLASDLTRN